MGGSAAPTSTQQPAIKGITLQTSIYGVVRAVVYGTTRIPPNLIGYSDFCYVDVQNATGGK